MVDRGDGGLGVEADAVVVGGYDGGKREVRPGLDTCESHLTNKVEVSQTEKACVAEEEGGAGVMLHWVRLIVWLEEPNVRWVAGVPWRACTSPVGEFLWTPDGRVEAATSFGGSDGGGDLDLNLGVDAW